MEYWLNEAEEWLRLRKASRQSLGADDANLEKPAYVSTTSAANHDDFACGERAPPLCDLP
jgi:hypothetical protein